MAETPTLYVCHGDEGGPSVHPCRRVQEALHDAGIEACAKARASSFAPPPARRSCRR